MSVGRLSPVTTMTSPRPRATAAPQTWQLPPQKSVSTSPPCGQAPTRRAISSSSWSRDSPSLESGAARPATGLLRGVFRSLRPHQWTKNLVVFAAVGLSKHLFELQPLLRSLLAFVLFCGLSGTVYLLNDVADVERDRLHPLKRLRPIARLLDARGGDPVLIVRAAT